MAIAIIIVVATVSIWAIVRLTRVAPRPAPGGRTRSAGRQRTTSAARGGTSGYVYGQGGFRRWRGILRLRIKWWRPRLQLTMTRKSSSRVRRRAGE